MTRINGSYRSMSWFVLPIGFKDKRANLLRVKNWLENTQPELIARSSPVKIGGATFTLLGIVAGLIGIKLDNPKWKWLGGILTLFGGSSLGTGFYYDSKLKAELTTINKEDFLNKFYLLGKSEALKREKLIDGFINEYNDQEDDAIALLNRINDDPKEDLNNRLIAKYCLDKVYHKKTDEELISAARDNAQYVSVQNWALAELVERKGLKTTINLLGVPELESLLGNIALFQKASSKVSKTIVALNDKTAELMLANRLYSMGDTVRTSPPESLDPMTAQLCNVLEEVGTLDALQFLKEISGSFIAHDLKTSINTNIKEIQAKQKLLQKLSDILGADEDAKPGLRKELVDEYKINKILLATYLTQISIFMCKDEFIRSEIKQCSKLLDDLTDFDTLVSYTNQGDMNNVYSRVWAIGMLSRREQSRATEILNGYLKDPNLFVQIATVHSLKRVATNQAVDILQKQLEIEERIYMRELINDAIKKIKEKKKSFVENN